MSDWPLEIVDGHSAAALSRLTSQYADAERLRLLVKIHADRMQELEGALQSVLRERWVPEAAGVQLDELGAIVGEPRLGRDDDGYREAIEVRISVNQSGGEPERIIEFLVRITGAEQVLYQEPYPANIEIFVRGETSLQGIERVRQLVPAGVGRLFISTVDDTPFGMSELGQVPFPDIDGFGEMSFSQELLLSDGDTLGLSSGTVLGVRDSDSGAVPTEGGYFAELFEV